MIYIRYSNSDKGEYVAPDQIARVQQPSAASRSIGIHAIVWLKDGNVIESATGVMEIVNQIHQSHK